MSLKRKIQKMLSSMPDDFVLKALGAFDSSNISITDFSTKLVNTRVFITHGTERSSRYSSTEIMEVTMVLRELERYFFLKELGLPQDILIGLTETINQLSNTSVNQIVFNL